MQKRHDDQPRGPSAGSLSRRQLLAGVAVAALAGSATTSLAKSRRKQGSRATPSKAPLRRYMASAAVLGDGRILVTGGYDRPWSENGAPMPLNTALIYDPANGAWSNAAPMSVPRARHAAVALGDGRVAVLGGMGMFPTASVEIYDARTNTWEAAAPMAQPRYDHNAVSNGTNITILGGASSSMLSSVESYVPGSTSERS